LLTKSTEDNSKNRVSKTGIDQSMPQKTDTCIPHDV